MSKKRKLFLIVSFCLFNAVIIILFLNIRSSTMLNVLKKEENELLSLNMTVDRYQRKIQSRGKYGVVEKAIKEYLDDYAVSLQSVLSEMDNPSLKSVLSYDNYSKDGPLFINSLTSLKEGKKDFNERVESLLEKTSDESIKKNIIKVIKDDYYIRLYDDFMFSDKMKDNFTKNKELIINVQEKVNIAYDTSTDILNFLAQNNGAWKIEDGQIKFVNNDLYNQYNSYIAKLSVQKKED